jgi:hypothetical protein
MTAGSWGFAAWRHGHPSFVCCLVIPETGGHQEITPIHLPKTNRLPEQIETA